MALKYERGRSTGIYVEGRWHATGRVSMYKVALMKTRSMDLDVQFPELERKARRILRQHKIKLKRKTGWPAHKLPDDTPPIAKDAATTLYQVHILRDHIAAGDVRNAVLIGIRLGAALERMRIRPFEPFVKTGRKIKESARRGGLMRKPPTGTWATWQIEVNVLHDRHPDLSFRAIAKIVGKNFNRDERTIRRRTKNPH